MPRNTVARRGLTLLTILNRCDRYMNVCECSVAVASEKRFDSRIRRFKCAAWNVWTLDSAVKKEIKSAVADAKSR